MKQRCVKFSGILLVLALVFSPLAMAHEFIIKPVSMAPEPGEKLPFSVISAHVFMVSEEMEPLDQVDVSLIRGETKTNVDLVKNPTLMTLDGIVNLEDQGTYILCGHRKGMLWSQTTQGWKQAGKKGLSGVISSGKYEKFCKVLVNAGQSDEGYRQVIGHDLEIIPMGNPADVKVGDEASFKILFKGAPLSTKVYATYDGFSRHPNTYAYFTETDENGVGIVKIHHAGRWMVRVENKIETKTEDYDTHALRAVLVFDIE
jgi:uncharacterized GH25 family protein